MKKIMITGAGGYIGTKMIESFLSKDYFLVAIDRFYFGDTLNDFSRKKNLKIVKNDIRSLTKNDFKGIDAVIDLASISNDPSSELLPKITTDINFKGAVHLAALAKSAGVKKYIFSSSCSIYGAGKGVLTEESGLAPLSTYARSKIAAEREILKLSDKKFSVTILRNATVYGVSARRMRFDLIINIMTLHAWKNQRIYVMGQGKQWRPLIHILDLIEAFHIVLVEENTQLVSNQVFNVGSNEQNYQVYQVAQFYRKHFSNLLIEQTPDDPDPRSYHVSFDKIKRILNFTCKHSVDDGILEVKNALEQGKVYDKLNTRTVDYYKYLIQAEKILTSLKFKNKLF